MLWIQSGPRAWDQGHEKTEINPVGRGFVLTGQVLDPAEGTVLVGGRAQRLRLLLGAWG